MNRIAVVKYKDYSIEKSGGDFYIKDPSGSRAFGEVPASVEIAKKWIDADIRDKGRQRSGGYEMNRIALARELVRVARSLVSMEFPTQGALDDYLKAHPGADRSMHTVRDKNKEGPKKGWPKMTWM